MKFGMRKPSLKKSIKARTTGKAKRAMKKAINPLYGKKGMGIINNPKKAMYNKVYNKTTFGVNDIMKNSTNNVKSIKTTSKSTNNYSKEVLIDETKLTTREQAYREKVEPLLKQINTCAQALENVDNPYGFSWLYKEAERFC